MEGNNKSYPVCLHIVMCIVGTMLCGMGVVGYLWKGEHSAQIIIQNLEPGRLRLFALSLHFIPRFHDTQLGCQSSSSSIQKF